MKAEIVVKTLNLRESGTLKVFNAHIEQKKFYLFFESFMQIQISFSE